MNLPALETRLEVLAGAAITTYGAWRAWSPAGYMVAGVILLAIGLIGARNLARAAK